MADERQAARAMEIGRRISERREAAGLKQGQLAVYAGVSRSYVSRLERGEYPRPSIIHIQKIATALGVDVEQILGHPSSTDIDIADPEMEVLFRQLESADLPEESRETIKEFLRFSLQRHWDKHPDSKLGR